MFCKLYRESKVDYCEHDGESYWSLKQKEICEPLYILIKISSHTLNQVEKVTKSSKFTKHDCI